jgi:hypothetical protein
MRCKFASYSHKIIKGEKMAEEENPNGEETKEENLGEQPLKEAQQKERPSTVVIQTPLDRPEFDWFLDQYMQKMGIVDRKQAAISLTNMFYDMGLDPYGDLKDLQESMQQMNMMLKNLPNTPAALQVKDTLGAMYAAKTGRAMLDRMPRATSTDPMMERMEKILDKYMPMIMAMNMMGNMMNPQQMMQQQQYQQQRQQPQENNHKEKAEIPEEFKAEIAGMREQLQETQNMLREQAVEKREKEFRNEIISTVGSNVNPQIEALRSQVENLATALQARNNEPLPPQQPNQEMTAISREIEELRAQISKKEKEGLNLTDLDTVMATIESIEKRIKKDVPAGEFDWKSTTINTLGEVGKEVVNAFKEIQSSKQSQQSTQPSRQSSSTDIKQVVKQKVRSYILQNLKKGVYELRMDEAVGALNLTQEQIFEAYNELKAEGWIKDKEQQEQKTSSPSSLPSSPSSLPSSPSSQPQQNTGATPNGRFDENAPFLER